jgi:IS5 family transposase
MKPAKRSKEYQQDLLKTQLVDLIDMSHSLVQLADKFNWQRIDELCAAKFCQDNGRPGLSSRLVIGLLLLKQMNGLSDEEICSKFIENPYYQYFCGNRHFEHQLVMKSESLTQWRKRLGDELFQQILIETINLGLEENVIAPKELSEVISDTTVQEKNISYPTDGKLLCRAIEHLVKSGKDVGIKFRQTYHKQAPQLRNRVACLLHARKPGQAKKYLKTLRTLLGRIIRDVERKSGSLVNQSGKAFETLQIKLKLANRIFEQKRDSKDKIYSIHEPDVSCIAKGKAHKKYEYGSKVGLISTIKNSFIIAVESFKGNPYDGKTLPSLLLQAESNTGIKIATIVLDKGFRGCKKSNPGIKVMLSGDRNLTPEEKEQLNQRSKIEGTIGLSKSKCGLGRNFLKGVAGDKLNATLSAIAYNLKMILRVIFYLIIEYVMNFVSI